MHHKPEVYNVRQNKVDITTNGKDIASTVQIIAEIKHIYGAPIPESWQIAA
jgi:hypothetical protein